MTVQDNDMLDPLSKSSRRGGDCISTFGPLPLFKAIELQVQQPENTASTCRSSAKSRRTDKRPTALSSLLNMLTILITFRKIYFLTNFLIFCYITFLRKMAKIKNFQVRMPIDWKLNNELNEV